MGWFKTETCLLFRVVASLKSLLVVSTRLQTATVAKLKEDADQVKNERDETKAKHASPLNEQKAAQKK
jgi:hypothetical protein